MSPQPDRVRAQQARQDSGGPYLQTAAFCESVLQEANGVVSLIRLVDRFIFTGQGADAPTEMPPGVAISLNIVLGFKSGTARASANVRIVPEDPSGLHLAAIEIPIFFEGDDRGNNIVAPLNFQPAMSGLYWFAVFVDQTFMTKMPLRVIYQRLAIGQMSNAG